MPQKSQDMPRATTKAKPGWQAAAAKGMKVTKTLAQAPKQAAKKGAKGGR